jgi:hypothetical protein
MFTDPTSLTVISTLAGIAAVVVALPSFRDHLCRYWPRLKFSDTPYSKQYVQQPEFRRSAKISVGSSEIFAVVTPRVGTVVRAIDVRFVEGRVGWWRRNAYPGQVTISNLSVRQDGYGDTASSEVSVEKSSIGGCVAKFSPARTLSAGEEVYLHVAVSAEAPWQGLLSVEIKGDKVRARARRRVSVRR